MNKRHSKLTEKFVSLKELALTYPEHIQADLGARQLTS